MSDEPETPFTPTLAKIFDPYYAHARALYEKGLSSNTALPAPDESSSTADILAWKDIVDEVFLMKVKRHLPFPEPEDMLERREAVIQQILSHAFAPDDAAANKLYKNLARHAHVALEKFYDGDKDADHKRPYALEIDKRGVALLRGAKGRWQSAKSPAELELREAMAEMKMEWAHRVRDPYNDALLEKTYGILMARWKLGSVAWEKFDDTADHFRFSPRELLASGDEYLAAHYGMVSMHEWPDKNRARHAQAHMAIDEAGAHGAVIHMALLQRAMVELKQLVWEYAEQERPKGALNVDTRALERDLNDRFYKDLQSTIRRFQPVVEKEMEPEQAVSFANDFNALVEASARTIVDYLRASTNKANGPKL